MWHRYLRFGVLLLFFFAAAKISLAQTQPPQQASAENLKSRLSQSFAKGQSRPAPEIVSRPASDPANANPLQVLFADDFEANTANWSFQGSLWQIGRPTSGPGAANSGVRCAATNLAGNYPDNAAGGLLSRNIALPALPHPRSTIVLKFWTWYETESGYDKGVVRISTNNGQTWISLRVFEGSRQAWGPSVIDLSAYAGRNVRLNFYFTSDGSANYAGWFVDDVTINLIEIATSNNIEIAVAENGQFTMGIPSGPILLFGHPRPWSSATTIRIDGQEHWNFLYQPWGATVSSPTTTGLSNTGIWNFPGNLQVRQTLTIVQGSTTGNFDTGEIRYTVTNNDATAHQISLRVMLDTMLGLNDGAPFRVPGAGAVTTEQEWDANRMPPYFQAFDDLNNPTVQSQGTLIGGNALKPDRFVATGWAHLIQTSWAYTTIPGRDFYTPDYGYDSAVGIYWFPVTLASGETKEFVTYYGLGGIDVDIQPPLVAGLSALRSLVLLNGSSPDNPFTLSVYLSNTSPGVTQTARGVQTVLTLPNGLALAPGENAAHPLADMPVNSDQQTDYKIQVKPTAAGEQTYSLFIGATNIASKTVAKSVYVFGIETIPKNEAEVSGAVESVSATFNVAMDPATINENNFKLFDEASQMIGGVVSYNAATKTAGFRPSSALKPESRYAAQISVGMRAFDGHALPHEVRWSFKTSKRFDVSRDGYKFRNSAHGQNPFMPNREDPFPAWEVFREAFGRDQTEFENGVHKPAAEKFWKSILDAPWGGSCDGFSSSAYRFYFSNSGLSLASSGLSFDPDPENRGTITNNIQLDDQIRLLVNAHQLYQCGRQVTASRRLYGLGVLGNGDYRDFLNDLKNSYNLTGDAGKPAYLIGITYKQFYSSWQFFVTKGHSLIPYRLEEYSAHPGVFKIYVYDPNFPYNPRDLQPDGHGHAQYHERYLIVDTNDKEWYFHLGPGTNGVFEDHFASSSDDVIWNSFGANILSPLSLKDISAYFQTPLLPTTAATQVLTAKTAQQPASVLWVNCNRLAISEGGAKALEIADSAITWQSNKVVLDFPLIDQNERPRGYYALLQDGEFKVEFGGVTLQNSAHSVRIFQENAAFDLNVENGSENQPNFLGLAQAPASFKYSTRNAAAKYSAEMITTTPTAERVVYLHNSRANRNDTLSFQFMLTSGNFYFANQGEGKSYDLELRKVSVISDTIGAVAIHINQNESHTIKVGSWDSLKTTRVVIEVDAGLDGTIDRIFSLRSPATGGRLDREHIYAYPNPFDPNSQAVIIRYSLSRDGEINIKIYDVSNQLVKTVLQDRTRRAGVEYADSWDGRNEKGELVANGVYFYIIASSSGERAVGKVAVLR